MRKGIILLGLLLWAGTPARAEVSIGISVNMFPQLMVVPGYPVYYAPDLDSNYFFYDDAYWVYQDDTWYTSAWYNGPWELIGPEFVPLYVLRIPVRYYRRPPQYFRGWQADRPPRWDEHWGRGWSQRRSGWDHWDRRAVPAPAPLPVYQRQYSGARYPAPSQQRALQPRKPSDHVRDVGNAGRDRPQRDQQQPGSQPQQQPRSQPKSQPQQQQRPQQHPQQQPQPQQPPQRSGPPAHRAEPAASAPRQQSPDRRNAAPAKPPQARGDQRPDQRKGQREPGDGRDERPHR